MNMTFLERAKDFLFRRAQSYRLVFDRKSPRVQEVLEDLAKFCRATETTFHTDERKSLVLQGRHEVWLRIQEHINLSDEDLWALKHPREENNR